MLSGVERIFRTKKSCPFCGKSLQSILPNLPLQRLFEQELIKVEGKIDEREKERLQKIEANKKL